MKGTRRFWIFGLGWLAYGSTYLLRKPLGVIKADLESELHLSKSLLGLLDTAMLLPYALVQLVASSLGDRFGPRRTMSVCMCLSAVSMATFGWWSNVPMFLLLLFMNGASQALCWPSCTKVLSSWFSGASRNVVFGLFGTCAFAGGIAGTVLAVHLQNAYGWRGVHYLPCTAVVTLGLLVYFFYCEETEQGDLHQQQPFKYHERLSKPARDSSSVQASAATTWFQLWKMPCITEISLAVFCLKIVRYCMYMWLPMYLLHQLQYDKTRAGLFSPAFELGGVVGSSVLGLALDRWFEHNPLAGVAVSIACSAGALVGFVLTSTWGHAANATFMMLAGAFNCGPDSILGGSIPAALGKKDKRDCSAAVTGFVNGFGSIGVFLEGPLVGILSDLYGWSSMFYCMIGLTLAGCLATLRASSQYKQLYSTAAGDSVTTC